MHWWHRHERETDSRRLDEAKAALDDAQKRAEKSKKIMEEQAEIAQMFREQRITNGFAEVIGAILVDSSRKDR